mgnify:CR=1 FL=1|tara:strand:- start:380 stop:601 length:222 start_codon:yes stop_codon:yes gene_type:complete
MIVFPILNFVLPLMLTSFILGNDQVCVKCEREVKLKTGESYNVEKSQLKIKKNNFIEIQDKNLNIGKNSRNVK